MPENQVPHEEPDYEFFEELGHGGFGVVYRARQRSLERDVAAKRPRRDGVHANDQLQHEATLLGELEHPNIVPVYDLEHDADGRVFYAMKQIKGTAWAQVLRHRSQAAQGEARTAETPADDGLEPRSQDEHIETLLRVADAIAFAHSRGVVHLDLKPQNIMLGRFGEVLVTDWGSAITPASPATNKERGTPEYASPEAARGLFADLGKHSDIYLLGAILFEIVTGRPPHKRRSGAAFVPAARNEIDRQPDEKGELLEIALKALETDPQARFASVEDLQKAIREYQSHAASISLASGAESDLTRAAETKNYDDYAAAVFGFQEACRLWPGNTRAAAGVVDAKRAYAQLALDKEDFDLGLSRLDPAHPEHAELYQELRKKQQKSKSRKRWLTVLQRVTAGLGVLLLIGFVVVYHFYQKAEQKTKDEQAQREIAEQKTKDEKEQRRIAERKTRDERKQREIADQKTRDEREQREIAEQKTRDEQEQRKIADQKTKDEKEQRSIAEQEAYLALIGAAAARVDENSFREAQHLLQRAQDVDEKHNAGGDGKAGAGLRNWEWGRLKYLCQHGVATLPPESPTSPADSPLTAAVFLTDGRTLVTGDRAGVLRFWDCQDRRELKVQHPPVAGWILALDVVRMGALEYLSIGSNDHDHYLSVWKRQLPDQAWEPVGEHGPDVFHGHRDAVTSVCFARPGAVPEGQPWLVTGSLDKSFCVWDLRGRCLARRPRHEGAVYCARFAPVASGATSPDLVLTTGQDGWAMLSTVDLKGMWGEEARWYALRINEAFGDHGGPVYAAEFLGGAKRLATAGQDGRIRIWEIRPRPPRPKELGDPDRDRHGQLTLSERYTAVLRQTLSGHKTPVRSLHALPGGKQLVSCGDDNAVRLWDLESGRQEHAFEGTDSAGRELPGPGLLRECRGHSGPVVACDYDRESQQLVTASYDGTAKLWPLEANERTLAFGGRVITHHVGGALAAEFSQDGACVVSGGMDRTAVIQDLHKLPAVDATPVKLGEGHDLLIRTILWPPERPYLITSSVDGTVRLWDHAKGRQADVFGRSDTGRAGAVAMSSSGRWIATGSDPLEPPNSTQATGKPPLHLSPGLAKLVADPTAWIGPKLRLWGCQLWDVQSRQMKHVFGCLNEVTAVALSSNDKYLLAGDTKGRCWLWDLDRSTLLWGEQQDHRIHTGPILAVWFLPGDQQILVASRDGTFTRWEVATGRGDEHRSLQPHQRRAVHAPSLHACTLSPNKQLVAGAYSDGTVCLWDVEQSAPLQTFTETAKPAAIAMNLRRFLRDNRHSPESFARSSSARRVAAEDLQKILQLGASHESVPADLEPSLAKLQAAVHRKDLPGEALRWARISALAFSPDGRYLVLASPDDRTLRCRLVQQSPGHDVAGAVIDLRRAGRGHSEEDAPDWPALVVGPAAQAPQRPVVYPVTYPVLFADGTRIRERELVVDSAGGQMHWGLPAQAQQLGSHSGVIATRFSPLLKGASGAVEKGWIVTADWDGVVKIWERPASISDSRPADGRRLPTLQLPQVSPVHGVCLASAQPLAVLTACDDGCVRRWTLHERDGGQTLDFEKNPQEYRSGTKTAGGPLLAVQSVCTAGKEFVIAGDSRGVIRIWDAAGGAAVKEWQGHQQAINCLAVFVSGEGLALATGSDDMEVRLWDGRSGAALNFRDPVAESLPGLEATGRHNRSTEQAAPLRHPAAVTAVGFSPDGRRLITGCQNGAVKVWDRDSRRELLTLNGHTKEVTSVAFQPTWSAGDCQYALSSSRDGAVLLWSATNWQPNSVPGGQTK